MPSFLLIGTSAQPAILVIIPLALVFITESLTAPTFPPIIDRVSASIIYLPEDVTNGALPTIAKSKFVEDLSVSLMSGLLIVTVFLSTKNESLFSALTSFVGIEK